MLSLSADHVAAFTLWPHGPGETTVVCELLFHPDEQARPSFDPSDAADFWDPVNRQGLGHVRERPARHGLPRLQRRLVRPMEEPSLDIRRYVLERLGEEDA
jgi:glycine betaine catabolism A